MLDRYRGAASIMQLTTNRYSMAGVSLVELMVGMAIGLMVITGAIVVFSNVVGSQSSILKAMRLEQELRSIMDLISRDLRRAGYWSMAQYGARPLGTLIPSAVAGDIVLTSSAGATPFQPFGAAIAGLRIISSTGFATITGYNGPASVDATVTRNFANTGTIAEGRWMIVNPFLDETNGTDIVVNGSCIQYAYDAPPYTEAGVKKVDTTVDANERYGFRRISISGIGVVQMHTGGMVNCADGTGSWTKVSTDNVVNVTQLTFSQTNERCINANTGTDCNPAHVAPGYSPATYVAPVTGQVLVWMREVEVRLEGSLLSDASITRTLLENVRVRNDRITVQ